jgi:hypothetical protein
MWDGASFADWAARALAGAFTQAGSPTFAPYLARPRR